MKKILTNIKGRLRQFEDHARSAAAKTGLFAFCKPEQIQPKRTSAHTINEADHRQTTALQGPPKSPTPVGTQGCGIIADLQGCPNQLSRTTKTARFASGGQMPSEPQIEATPCHAWQLEEGEAASYTSGSPSLILAGDGSKPCVALLPDHDLVQKLLDAVAEKHCIEQAEEISDADVNRLQNAHNSIGLDIEDLEDSIADVETPETEEAKVRLRKQQKKLEKLRRKQQALEEQKKASRRVLESRHRAERYNLHLLLDTVEEVLIRSKMLRPADETVDTDPGEGTDAGEVEEPLLAAAAEDQGSRVFSITGYEDGAQAGSSDVNTSDSDSDISEPVNDEPEFTETAIIIRRYQSAQTRVRVMDEAFDTRQARFDEEAEERSRKLDAGEEVESELAFDLRQIQVTRQLAKQVTEAEEALLEAKAAAVAAGVQVPGSDVESGFVDDVNDGYRISSEEDVAASISRHSVHMWMQAVSDGYTEDTSEVEVDNWDAKSVDISDSASMVADGAARNRIDRWRAACYALEQVDAV